MDQFHEFCLTSLLSFCILHIYEVILVLFEEARNYMTTEQEETSAILEAATGLAEKLGLTKAEDDFRLVEDQTVLVASKFGMEFGKVRVYDSVTGRFHVTEYRLNGEDFMKDIFTILERKLEPFRRQTFYPDDAVIYTGK